MRELMTLTTPPIAADPNSKAEGPRRISIRSAVSGLIATAWSALDEDRSRLPMPSVRMRMRSPPRPRRIGREAAGPKLVALTPGCLASVSPMLGRIARHEFGAVDHRHPAEHVVDVAADAGDDDRLVVMAARVARVGAGGAGLAATCAAVETNSGREERAQDEAGAGMDHARAH